MTRPSFYKASLLYTIAILSLLANLWHIPGNQSLSTAPPIPQVDPPAFFHHQALYPVPFTEKEEAFYRNFPGMAAAFVQQNRRLIWRMVERPTRKMHPARDCFKGMGFRIEELGLHKDPYEDIWSSFLAYREGETLRVSEAIHDKSGNTCSDISAWFWEASLHRDQGPWTYWVIIEAAEPSKDSA